MKHIIIGTAGHVDHGKTTLVKAMTGHDTDRLTEEKERGISIELGFAPLVLKNGEKVGLVDVPGHERFIKNMLAGVGGIDLVMLVIAADEGVMPQTREHLDIIHLLQIPRGIVVLSKVDLVEQDWVDLVSEEIREVLQGTGLADAPIIPVSATTGQGIPQLMEILEQEVALAEEKKGTGPFRLPVDRCFSVTGFGTIVTGTLAAGEIKVGDGAVLLPGLLETKIRTLQVHGTKVDRATAGQRVAVNLAGLEVPEVHRGDVVATPGLLQPSYRLDVEFHLLASAAKNVENRQRMRLHLGTTEALCRIILLDKDELEPGNTVLAQLLVEQPVVAAKHDRFVLRTYSPMHTVGGGVIIDPNPVRHRRFRDDVIASLATKLQGTPDELLEDVLVKVKDKLVTEEEAFVMAELSPEVGRQALKYLEGVNRAVVFTAENKGVVISSEVFLKWVEGIQQAVEDFHRAYPLRTGLSKEELRSRLFPGIPNKSFNSLLQHLDSQGLISVREQAVSAAGWVPEIPDHLRPKTDAVVSLFHQNGWQPPGWEEAAAQAGLPEEWQDEMLRFLINQGLLVKLADEIYFHRECLQAAKEKIVTQLEANQQISLAEVRDLLGSSRKYILPLLEYLDRTKVTRRVGDARVRF
ncbi:MAG TPA: selenocysteine-specific translation elongation factor [Bacillota bacterium]|nr:selenocysteine-specific translation elongation factor [Bacillota bacterium]